MKIFVMFGYSARAVGEVTASELEVFQRVLDRLHAADTNFYNTEDIALSKTPTIDYSIKLVPASVRVLPYATAAEESANG